MSRYLGGAGGGGGSLGKFFILGTHGGGGGAINCIVGGAGGRGGGGGAIFFDCEKEASDTKMKIVTKGPLRNFIIFFIMIQSCEDSIPKIKKNPVVTGFVQLV
jgi:hypothetical protein